MGALVSCCLDEEEEEANGAVEDVEQTALLRPAFAGRQQARVRPSSGSAASAASGGSAPAPTEPPLRAAAVAPPAPLSPSPPSSPSSPLSLSHLGVVSVGVIGTGRSSLLNTLLNSSSACLVSGGQLQGTRGCEAVLGARPADCPGGAAGATGAHPLLTSLDYIDCEGLRSDQAVRKADLCAYMDLLAPAAARLRAPARTTRILFTLDMEDRQNAPTVANLLTLVELFRPVAPACFLCLSKWNTNAVQAEWNRRLLTWARRHKRAEDASEVAAAPPPPSPDEMMADYAAYVDSNFSQDAEAEAKAKLKLLLESFQGRVVWAYNLDSMQQEDREDGELAYCEEFLFQHYRDIAIRTLVAGNAAGAGESAAEESAEGGLSALPFMRPGADVAALAGACIDATASSLQALAMALS